jgi:hypothetical protein
MHPAIAQLIVAERARDIQAGAAATAQARRLRRSRHARRTWLFGGAPRSGRGPAALPAGRPKAA